MSGSSHEFECRMEWTGAAAGPVRDYASYSREVKVTAPGKPPMSLSAAAAFRGDDRLCNAEDLLVASLSVCHFLSYAAVCARSGVVLVAYEDAAWGRMAFDPARKVMAFQEVVLRPIATVGAGSDEALALRLHERAHHECFIANSVNFPVRNEPVVRRAG
jgi:organic hydroperoxide reductase OsmC/OhrA